VKSGFMLVNRLARRDMSLIAAKNFRSTPACGRWDGTTSPGNKRSAGPHKLR